MLFTEGSAENNELTCLGDNIKRGVQEQLVHGVSGAQKAYLAARILEQVKRPALFLTSHLQQAETVAEDLATFLPGRSVLTFPPAEVLPYEYYAESPELTAERLAVLSALVHKEDVLVVAPIAALSRRLPPPKVFRERGFLLRPGNQVERDDVLARLMELGYERVERVEGRSQFAVRGDIIDIFPLPAPRPIRLELFDTTVDSLREFEPESQRSTARLGEAWIGPASETCLTPREQVAALERLTESASAYQKILKERGLSGQAERVRLRVEALVERALEGLPEARERLLPFAYKEGTTFVDYLPRDTLLFLDEPLQLVEEGRNFERDLKNMQTRLLEEGSLLPEEARLYNTLEDIMLQLGGLQRIGFSLFQRRAPYSNPQAFVAVVARELTPYHKNEERLIQDLRHWHLQRYAITLHASSEARAQRLREWLKANAPGVSVGVQVGTISAGFELPSLKVVEIADGEIFGRTRRRERRSAMDESAVPSFTDLKVGDLVVHVVHGIGRYRGVETLESAGSTRDYLLLEYAGQDRLYVPTDQVYLLQKYVGPEGENPRLSKLGGNEWQRARSRVKRSVEEMAKDLLALYAKREATPGYAFSKDTVWQKEFEEAFPYEETDDQLRAIEEIKRDMESPHPMDRLLCGDVGFGKTEVAIRAAFKAVMDGKQVAVLVPTTILAQQHFNTFRERLVGYPVQVEMLSRFRSTEEQREILKKLRRGAIDIIIGTHRLVSKDVRFADLGLVIIDEEQRFGVRQKERLKELKASVDVLTLTATPIPRTLHLSMVGLRDMSVIQTPPEDRYPVQTYVVEYSDSLVRDAIARELGRGGQVFYFYNRVEGIEAEANRVKELLPHARVAVAHGQLSETRLSRIVLNFLAGEYDVLVCTSIIENGLDMPNVNTLVVKDADRLGLSQLYQLRGRVGRSNRVAYAYFTYQPQKLLSPVAEKRLQALREFTELGSGFKLAIRDLEIRGAGNILGAEQHGHIAAVGFEMYCRLLEEAVRELKGEKQRHEVEPQIDLKINAYLPETYVRSPRDKMELYKAIVACKSEADVDEVADDLVDRFGDPPDEVVNLLQIARLRTLAYQVKITALAQKEDRVVITFAPGLYLTPEDVFYLSRVTRRRLAPTPDHEQQLVFRTAGLPPRKIVPALLEALQHLKGVVAAHQVKYNETGG
ncbi:MAG: transcription-repair coupling factor [bacterium]